MVNEDYKTDKMPTISFCAKWNSKCFGTSYSKPFSISSNQMTKDIICRSEIPLSRVAKDALRFNCKNGQVIYE